VVGMNLSLIIQRGGGPVLVFWDTGEEGGVVEGESGKKGGGAGNKDNVKG